MENDSSGSAVWADENVGRDVQLLAQSDDHGDGQGPLAVEHFGDARSASDDARKGGARLEVGARRVWGEATRRKRLPIGVLGIPARAE